MLHVCVCSQEDDINGEHIVAFAEEDDPGTLLLSFLSINNRSIDRFNVFRNIKPILTRETFP